MPSQTVPTMRVWMLCALAAACTTTTHVDQGSTVVMGVVGSICPSGADAEPAIQLTEVGAVIETGKDSACTVDDVLSVGEPTLESAVTRCCFAVRCDGSVTAADGAMLFEATCFDGPCAAFDLSTITPARARDELAAHLPGCTLDASSPGPVDTAAVNCDYVVDEAETCHSGGLGS